MRIAIDARYVNDHFPGIGRYVYHLARELAAMPHGHTLLLIHTPARPSSRYDLTALAGPRTELLPTGARPFSLAEQVAIPALLRRARADLYHAPYYVRPLLPLPCPAVTTLYDAIPRLFPGEVSLRARLLFDSLTRAAIARSRRLLTISRSARDDLAAAYGVPAGRIAVTPLAADARFAPQPATALAALRTRYGLPERYVLCVGSNKPHKNLPLLVEAWRLALQYPATAQVKLVLAGHWDARHPEARLLVAQAGLHERVLFVPNVAESDLPGLYAGAEVFAFPSRYEGFGLPPLEAMACGTPVVCGAVSSLPEVVGDAALFADIADPQALAGQLCTLLASPALHAELHARGLAQAARFSWRATAQATLAVYESLLPSR